ncbi:MAG: DUF418 domain-containing protein [Corynebacterium sp.]|uniref:DUF418 domain-containing protein n=1 Tax=Corynebacterium sp. TaxID=1720 RepID=UPI0026DB4BD9|nr:DUF418 domain-containing protein [Corynebacterium sp.]MDO4760739.1 DUF418 domain-containing protein [Corynebacterium sp.]
MEKITRKPRVRIDGFDVARALAIIGMVMAHAGTTSWPGAHIADGYASALFAVLAGISTSLMLEKATIAGGAELAQARSRLVMRGVIIFLIGIALSSLQSVIAIVLSAIALILMLLGPVTRWSLLKQLLFLVGMSLCSAAIAGSFGYWHTVHPLLTIPYPLFAWLAYGTAGMIAYRLLTHNKWWQFGSIALAALVMSVSYRARYQLDELENGPSFNGKTAPQIPSSLADPDYSSVSSSPGQLNDNPYGFFRNAMDISPHSGGLGDIWLSIVGAFGIISVCLLLCHPRFLRTFLFPFRSMGSMALTVYVLHAISAGWYLGGIPFSRPDDFAYPAKSDYSMEKYDDTYEPLPKSSPDDSMEEVPLLLITIGSALVLSSLWRLKFRRGPLEGMTHALLNKATAELPPLDQQQLLDRSVLAAERRSIRQALGIQERPESLALDTAHASTPVPSDTTENPNS